MTTLQEALLTTLAVPGQDRRMVIYEPRFKVTVDRRSSIDWTRFRLTALDHAVSAEKRKQRNVLQAERYRREQLLEG